MVVVRGTTKLLGRLKVEPEPRPGTSTTVLGDWFATLLQVRRGRFVLAISKRTLLPVVVLGRDPGSLPTRLAAGVAEVLTALGVQPAVVGREQVAMTDVRYARTDDRSTVGVLTELQRLLKYELDEEREATLLGMSLRLARTPIVARDLFPDRATCQLFGIAPPRP